MLLLMPISIWKIGRHYQAPVLVDVLRRGKCPFRALAGLELHLNCPLFSSIFLAGIMLKVPNICPTGPVSCKTSSHVNTLNGFPGATISVCVLSD